MAKFYGQTKTETNATEMIQCREIVSEIMNFGVKQNQVMQIIKLLALELENRDNMLAINECIEALSSTEIAGEESIKSLITS